MNYKGRLNEAAFFFFPSRGHELTTVSEGLATEKDCLLVEVTMGGSTVPTGTMRERPEELSNELVIRATNQLPVMGTKLQNYRFSELSQRRQRFWPQPSWLPI